MKSFFGLCILCLFFGESVVSGQTPQVQPRILTMTEMEEKVTIVEVAARFVTAIHLPDAVNSVVVGDPSEFQVEHSDREPKLVFVKAASVKPAQTNLLISTATGHQVSILLMNRGNSSPAGTVDFLLKYTVSGGFFVGPSGFPFALVGATVPLGQSTGPVTDGTQGLPKRATAASTVPAIVGNPGSTLSGPSHSDVSIFNLDELLKQQESSPLPVLYGEHVGEESTSGDHVHAGVSRVMDGGQEVIVLFSVVNPTKRAILLMPPQIELGGRTATGKLIRRKKWSTAEQLPIDDFRLNRRRLGLGERADGVVVFVRPPYKQSNETLLLQVAESGAVDRPALAPIGFGVSSSSEVQNGRGK